MRSYNTYGADLGAQMKVGDNLCGHHFSIGDKADIPDGLYLTYEGIIIVKEGKVSDEVELDSIFDKWGNVLDMDEVLDLSSPVVKAMKEQRKKI